MKGLRILSIIMFIFAISQFVYAGYSLIEYYETKDDIKIVDCYDKFGNQIYDTTCEQVGNVDAIQMAGITFFIGCFMIIMAYAMWLFEDY